MAAETEVKTGVVVIPEIENAALSWPDKSNLMVVQDQATYDGVAEALLNIKELAGQIKDHHRPVINAAHAAHKAACDAEKRLLTPLNQAEGILKGKLQKWDESQERLRLEAQRVAEEAAKKQAEEEALAAAQQAHEDGASMDDALAVLDEFETFQQPVVALPTYTANKKISMSYRWAAQVVSLMDLVKAIAAGKAPIAFIEVNMPALNKQAQSLQQVDLNIPGVKGIKVPIVSARR